MTKFALAMGCSLTKPESLVRGDAAVLLSPSYQTPYENIENGAALLRSHGLKPVIGENCREVFQGQYAGTPRRRAESLLQALCDPLVKAIICNRGGYGALHLLDLIPPETIAANPKWLVGYSDISTLHAMFNKAGVMSLHAPMCSSFAKDSRSLSTELMMDVLAGAVPRYRLPGDSRNIPGHAEGRLTGGNLCTITPLLGTWADWTRDGDFILFLEDVEEPMHNIDRQFNVLRLSGALDRCKGVILGEFTDCAGEFTLPDVESLLLEYLRGYGIPVVCGFPAGHDEVNLPLLMGARTCLDVTDQGAEISFATQGPVREILL